MRCLVAAFAPRHELIDAQFVPSGNAVVEIVQGWLFSPPCWRRAAVIELSDGIAAALDAHIVLTLPNQGSRSSAGILDRPCGTILRGAPNRFGKALLASQLEIFVARNAAAALVQSLAYGEGFRIKVARPSKWVRAMAAGVLRRGAKHG